MSMRSFPDESLNDLDKRYKRWIRKRLITGEAAAFIAEEGPGKVIASGAVFTRDIDPFPGGDRERSPHIISMFTEEPYRGRGIASQVLDKLVDWCRSNGFPVVTLSPTKKDPELYINNGFERSWIMIKRLGEPSHKPGHR